MANTQIKLRQLIQDGASSTSNVIKWNGSNWAVGTDNNGIYSGSGTVPSGTVATVTDSLTISESTSTSNALVIPFILDAKVNPGAGANDLGIGMVFQGETTTTENQELSALISRWTDATHATRTARLEFRLTSNGSQSTRLTLNPTSLVPGSNFTIGSTFDLTLGGSSGSVILSSSADSTQAIKLSLTGTATTNSITLVDGLVQTNSTAGTRENVIVNGSFEPTSGTTNFTSFSIKPTVNQTGGASGITRGIHIIPTITAASDFRAIDIGNTASNTYGIYQSGLNVLNLFSGNTGIGANPIASTKLYVSGAVRFDLGSDAQGDIFYRDSSGNFVRLPIGINGHVLTSNGTIPGWSAPGTGNGIYGGNGTIATAAVATLTASSTFTIDYSDGSNALHVVDTGESFNLYSGAGYGITANSTLTQMNGPNSRYLAVNGAGPFANGGLVIANGALKLASDVSPVQITANQNDYSPTNFDEAAVLRLNTDASRTITGFDASVKSGDGDVLTIINIGSFDIVLAHNSTNSLAANRMNLGGSNVTLTPGMSFTLIYDDTSNIWRPFNYLGATGGATDHGALTGLADDDHTQYALLAGRSTGQTLKGGTGVTDTLTLVGTSGNGTATNAAILFAVGNNGGTTAATILNNGKIGVGGTPDASALFDLTSTSLGFGLPSMTSTQRNAISSPRNGLVVYNSTDHAISVRANGVWVDLGSGGSTSYTIDTKTTDYTLVLGDANKYISMDSTSNRTISVPTNASVAYPVGTVIHVSRANTGTVTIAAVTPGTTTINSADSLTKLRSRYSTASLLKTATDTWLLYGDLTA